jgi:DNA repair protein RecN (Recombination protein N)
MSRFALAIKVALSTENDTVMVFDEVDQGIGGAVAHAVGERLSKLSKTNQIFVVTHSPQVAAKADSQYKIEKSTCETITKTSLSLISNEDREEEIARMLSGKDVTNEARAAAKQLINS